MTDYSSSKLARELINSIKRSGKLSVVKGDLGSGKTHILTALHDTLSDSFNICIIRAKELVQTKRLCMLLYNTVLNVQ